MIRKVIFLRKKDVGQNSIEELAYLLANALQDVKLVIVPYHSHSILGMIKNIFFAIKNKGDVNLIFSSSENYLSAFLGSKTIITYHDIGTIFISPKWINRKFRQFRSLSVPLFFANKITCISNFTKDELLKLYPNVKYKTTVIHNPYNPQIKYTPYIFNEECPTILHIGTAKRKNLLRVIKAVKDINCKLYIVGVLDQEQLDEIKSNNISYINEFDITFNRIIELYQLCDIVSFPTLYEGFGMPIVEANATGRPVLTSSIASIPEIAQSAAYFVDPYDVQSIKEGFLSLIRNKQLRENIILQGIENAKRFQIDDIVTKYYNILNF